jgi:hypothetical protein
MENIASQAAELVKNNPLVQLVQANSFVGWCFRMTYDQAHIMVNDLWKAKALGVPHNCFLVATAFDPEEFNKATLEEKEVILLRVTGAAKLPQDDDLVKAKIDYFQQHRSQIDEERDYDDITRNKMQFHGLECCILGTFYVQENDLWMGSDIESFSSATRLKVYRPRGKALKMIVNYVDPIRRQAAREAAEQLGIDKPVDPFRIGTVRYTSTDRLHRGSGEPRVPVHIQPSDFLARRTAVLGMTRTGKSNMIKQLVSVVKRVSEDSGVNIGQIIYDINGEYANANHEDEGAIADVYPEDEVVRYSMRSVEGFKELRTNFYKQITEGFGIVQRELDPSSNYQRTFVNQHFDEPDSQEYREHSRWERRVAAYKAVLFQAGFRPPSNHNIRFQANADVLGAVNRNLKNESFESDRRGNLTLKPEEAVRWFSALQSVNQEEQLTSSSSRLPWVSNDLQNLLDMLTQGPGDKYISGYEILADIRRFHAPTRTSDVSEEIYGHLTDGQVVILDLSLGNPTLREKISKDIASTIFSNSMKYFVKGKQPPNIVVYTEESHNLIGKDLELDETWPRLAKEGAKYNIAMVYATQEVSSVHPNILANTENWFITHLNNEREIKELARFYDFDDFSSSLIRAQDVGFARVKTLSGPFVIPTQIDEFDPEAEKKRFQEIQKDEAASADMFSNGSA